MWLRRVLILIALAGTGCSGEGGLGSPSLINSEATKAPFIGTAQTRMSGKAKPIPVAEVSTKPGTNRTPSGSLRAYSGTPDGLSLKEIYKSGALIELPRVQSYMHKIVDTLLQHWPYEAGRIGIFIVSNDGFDASVTAAGDILITSGMISQLESEDELAAILGHEVSHILLRHHERAEAIADNKKLMNAAASMAIMYLMYSNTDWTKTGKNSYQGTVNTSSWLTQSVQAGGACLAATYMIDKLIDPGWSRTQEDEADLLGIDLMMKSGYDPNAALQAMRRRVEYDGKQKTIVEQRQTSGEYDKMVTDSIAQQGVTGIFTGAARSISAGLIDTFSDVDNYISQKHRMSSDRLTGMQLYLDRHYSLRERKPLLTAPFNKVVRDKSVQKTFENYDSTLAVAPAVLNNDLAKGLELAKTGISPPTQNAVVPRFSMYMVQSALGNEEEAFKNLTAVKDIDSAPPQYFHALADGYARRGKMDQARAMKDRAIAKSKSIYDEKEKEGGGSLIRLLSGQSADGADRFEVTGFCEALRSTVSGTAGSITGRSL